MKITRTTTDGLIQETWNFWYNERNTTLVLSQYIYGVRPTKRHSFVVKHTYDRLMKRESNLEVDFVPLPDDVAAEVKALFVASITVSKNNTK